jgi:pheromone shutdown protein TraB
LERVYATNDHTADATIYAVLSREPQREKEYTEFMKRHFESASSAQFAKEYKTKGQSAPTSAEAMLDYYRYMNSPRVVTGSIENDLNRASKTASPQHYGRLYMAWWETRNLRMVANIRQVMGVQPARVLAVVGASHKAHFDAYLNLMHDVQLVDAEAILK